MERQFWDTDSQGLNFSRDMIVPAFSGTLLLSQWIVTKAIPGKTGTNHIPDIYSTERGSDELTC